MEVSLTLGRTTVRMRQRVKHVQHDKRVAAAAAHGALRGARQLLVRARRHQLAAQLLQAAQHGARHGALALI